jgi:hypothetical protein
MTNYLKNELEIWTEEDCLVITVQREYIRKVQAFKDRIEERMKALRGEHDNIRLLQDELAKQNLE